MASQKEVDAYFKKHNYRNDNETKALRDGTWQKKVDNHNKMLRERRRLKERLDKIKKTAATLKTKKTVKPKPKKKPIKKTTSKRKGK